LSASEYQHRFGLDLADYQEYWEPRVAEVFVGVHESEWVAAPEQVFGSPYRKFSFCANPAVGLESNFRALKSLLDSLDEERWTYINNPSPAQTAELDYAEDASYRYSFPRNIDWETFTSGDDASLYPLASIYDSYLLGESASWGIYYSESLSISLFGAKDDHVLSTFRKSFEIEKNEAEVIRRRLDRAKGSRREELRALAENYFE